MTNETPHTARQGRRRPLVLGLLVLSVLIAPAAFAQKPGQYGSPAAPTLKIDPPSAKPGQKVRLSVTIPLQPGLHVYGPDVPKPYYATKIKPEQGPIIWQDAPTFPNLSTLNVSGQTLSIVESNPKTNEVVLVLEGRLPPNVKPGPHEIAVKLTYQACSASTCLPPILNKALSTTLVVNGGNTIPIVEGSPAINDSVNTKPPKADGLGTSFSLFDYHIDLNKAGFWLAMVVAFIAGLLLNIMPCVLPVIPIKILQLAKQAHQEHHSPVRLALVFAGGIVAFFLAIGFAAVLLKNGFAWGQPFQNPALLIGICLVLIVLALGMFDIYQVRVPSFIANREVVQKGYLGAFSMGFLAGILSTPCSFGILGAAVAWAQSQKFYLTLLCFLTIGLGMATPYVGLSGFPKLINKVPHTGRWSELFKEAMGFLLLAVVAFLVTALPKDRILPVMLYFILFSFIVWFWGEVIEFRTGKLAKIGRIAVLCGLLATGWGLFKPVVKEVMWLPLSNESLSAAKASGKDVVIDFTADWCLNCRTVEYRIFGSEKIKELLKQKGVRMVKADLTEENEVASRTLRELTGQTGIPFTVVLKPNGKKILLPGIYSPEDFRKALGQ